NLYTCVINAEGKIIVAGSTTDYNDYRILLLQLNADGTLDSSFGDAGVVVENVSPAVGYFENFAADIALDANENILISGSSYNENYILRPVVLRFTPGGELDTTFGEAGVATGPTGEGASAFQAVLVQPDGKIIAAGFYGYTVFWTVLMVARFNEDGTLDTTFSEDGYMQHSYSGSEDRGFSAELTPDGKIVVAGFTITNANGYSAILMQVTNTGEIDTDFGNSGIVEGDIGDFDFADDLAILNDGTILVVGSGGSQLDFDLAIWKFLPDGTPDASFDSDGLIQHELDNQNAFSYGVAIQDDGKVVIAGQAKAPNNINHFLLARLEHEAIISVNEMDVNTFNMYPNPVAPGQSIRIDTNTISGSTMEFYSSTGALVYATSVGFNSGSAAFQLPSDLAEGIYLVAIKDQGRKTYSKQLVVTR
ncbi:MAG: T9SS type A sorting domain-containing protein, partial [Bacteroidia bacterium]